MLKFKNDTSQYLPPNWRSVTNGLGAHFCTSLEFMDITDSQMQGAMASEAKMFHNFRPLPQFLMTPPYYAGLLQGETVCTENITPWIKILPCRAQAGLGTLLGNTATLYDTHYHSMGVKFQPSKHVAGQHSLYLTLTLVKEVSEPTQLPSLFGLTSSTVPRCPIAKRTQLFVPIQSSLFSTATDTVGIFRVHNPTQTLDLAETLPVVSSGPLQGVSVMRSTLGWGQQRGQLVVQIDNQLPLAISAQLHQSLPWIMKLWYHTTEIIWCSPDTNGQMVRRCSLRGEEGACDGFQVNFQIQPAMDRGKPADIRHSFSLPANSTVVLVTDYDTAFLGWTEHPPDSHRGFDIAGGRLRVEMTDALRAHLQQRATEGHYMYTESVGWNQAEAASHVDLYTNGLLFVLPTPDFSMPYNVIMITSTAVALVFGSVFGAAMRRYENIYVAGAFVSDRPVASLLRGVLTKITALFQRKPKVA